MITCGSKGNVIIRDQAKSYDLSTSDGYASLVLRLTSPDERDRFDAGLFKVDANLPDAEKAKAERYSAFLSDFAKRREERLGESNGLTAEQREESIRGFIEQLKAGGAR